MHQETLRGKRVIAIIRRSTGHQADSFERQREIINSYVAQEGMILVEEVSIDAKSATTGAQLSALREVVNRKIDGENFDGIVFSDYARTARIMDDAERFYLDCKDADLFIATQKEGLLTGPNSWVSRNVAAHASQAFGQSHSVQTNSGVMRAVGIGRIPYSLVAPYAVDRLFLTSDGAPLYIHRRVGRQFVQKLSVAAEPKVLETFQGASRRRCIVRQGNERIEFVLGAQEAVKIVRHIYQRFFEQDGIGWGCHRIARELNDMEIPSPSGRKWFTSSIKVILSNSAYSGVGVSCKITCGVHSKRRKGSPEIYSTPRRPGYKNTADGEPRQMRSSVPALRRPISEWNLCRLPELMKLLPPKLRRAAKAYRRGVRHSLPAAKKPKPKAKIDSPYFLSHLLTTGGGTIPMTGLPTVSEESEPTRYYYVSRATNCPKSTSGLASRVRADHAETVVLQALADVLRSYRLDAATVNGLIADRNRHLASSQSTVGMWTRELETAESHLSFIMRAGPNAKRLSEKEQARLESRIEELRTKIAASGGRRFELKDDASEVVRSINKQFAELGQIVRNRPLRSLHNLVRLFVAHLDFDARTRLLDMELRLPSWALKKGDALVQMIRLPDISGSTTARQTNNEIGLFLAKRRFRLVRGSGRKQPYVEEIAFR